MITYDSLVDSFLVSSITWRISKFSDFWNSYGWLFKRISINHIIQRIKNITTTFCNKDSVVDVLIGDSLVKETRNLNPKANDKKTNISSICESNQFCSEANKQYPRFHGDYNLEFFVLSNFLVTKIIIFPVSSHSSRISLLSSFLLVHVACILK